jgi:hypothetical protein
MIRGGIFGPSSITRIASSFSSTASRGTRATPTPVPARPWTTPFSFERKTKRGSIPAARNWSTTISARAVADHRLRPDLLQRRRPLRGGERRIGGGDEHPVVAEQLERLERRVLERELDEREVEVPALDAVAEVAVGVGFLQLDLDVGPCSPEAPHHLGQDLRADALKRPDVERTRLACRQRRQIRLGGLQTGDDRLGVLEQDPPRLRQRHRARPARPLDEALADDPLEGGDLLADGGLGVAEPLRRPAERALGRHRFQRGEMAQLDAQPSIRFHDRYQWYLDLR